MCASQETVLERGQAAHLGLEGSMTGCLQETERSFRPFSATGTPDPLLLCHKLGGFSETLFHSHSLKWTREPWCCSLGALDRPRRLRRKAYLERTGKQCVSILKIKLRHHRTWLLPSRVFTQKRYSTHPRTMRVPTAALSVMAPN